MAEPDLAKAFTTYIEDVLTVQARNTPEWMAWFAERTNVAIEALGRPERIEYAHGAIRQIKRAGA